MTSHWLFQAQVKYKVLGKNNSETQLQWLIELCYKVGCHANLVLETDTVMSFRQNLPAVCTSLAYSP